MSWIPGGSVRRQSVMHSSVFRVLLLAVMAVVIAQNSSAWYSDTHTLICEKAGIAGDCNLADNLTFQKEHPDLDGYNHMCFDNDSDCNARAVAGEYLKQGRAEIAAHLFADSLSPAHWHSYYYKCHREFENKVNNFVINGSNDWEVSIYCNYKGEAIELKASDEYLQEVVNYVRNHEEKEKGYWQPLLIIALIIAIAAVALKLLLRPS